MALADAFVVWQSPYGSADPVKCPYRTPGPFNAYHLHPNAPAARALYRIYRCTGEMRYKAAADRYATFLMSVVQEPLESYTQSVVLNGMARNLFTAAWMYGKALSPCYEQFRLYNPREDGYELKAHAVYRWLQRHRRADSYFGVGYPATTAPDAQFASDLAEVGNGLVGFYAATGHRAALDDAIGLARFFLTEWEEGSGRGLWSSRIGMWLVGPWAGSGAEHFTREQQFNRSGWGSAAYMASSYLCRLHGYLADGDMRGRIADKCVRAMQWCYDICQFEDGPLGLFGRDDKWLGMTATAILLYIELLRAGLLPAAVDARYRPKVDLAWKWLMANTASETLPADGYIRVRGTTTRRPLENLFWKLCWTAETLVEAGEYFSAEAIPRKNASIRPTA